MDEQALDGLVSSGAQLLYKAVHAVHLTAEADGYNAVDVGIGCHAHQHVLRPAQVARGFAAAVLVYKADGAVDAVCRLARGLCCAAHRRKHEDVVADADLAIGPPKTKKLHALAPPSTPLVML